MKISVFFVLNIVSIYLLCDFDKYQQMQVYVFSQILWISCLLADFEKLFYVIIMKFGDLSTAIADFEIQNCRL